MLFIRKDLNQINLFYCCTIIIFEHLVYGEFLYTTDISRLNVLYNWQSRVCVYKCVHACKYYIQSANSLRDTLFIPTVDYSPALHLIRSDTNKFIN